MKRPRRLATQTALLALVLGTAVVAGAQPASASYSTLQATTWAYTDSHSPKTSYIDPAGDAPLGTRLDAGAAHTSRLYLTFDLSSLRGQVIHQAIVSVAESTVANCGTATAVELWRTSAISSNASWQRSPTELERLDTASAGNGWTCPGIIEFDFLAAVDAALARHDKAITVEVRLAAGDEPNPALFRTVAARGGLQVDVNHAPTVSSPAVVDPAAGCAGQNRPATANSSVSLSAQANDLDTEDRLSGQFAIWPVGQEDQRREYDGYGISGNFRANWIDLSGYPEGTVLAWTARAYDQQDYSAWTKNCYLRIDRTPPASAPIVTSRTYISGNQQSGGQGVAGQFRFDAGGDRDVVFFRYSDGRGTNAVVAAKHPGGSAVVSYTPTQPGPTTLTVYALDAAGNASPPAEYRFWVAFTAPYVQLTVGGVGLPSHIAMQSSAAGVTGFSYQIGTGPEVKFGATNGAGATDLTFTSTGSFVVVARSYAGKKVIGLTNYQVFVSDAPTVSSAQFDPIQSIPLGTAGSFTFAPATTSVVAYQYSINYGDWLRVDAGADGVATLAWTADQVGYTDVEVASIQADGTISQQTSYAFDVIDTHPSVYASDLQNYPRTDGVGVPTTIEFYSEMPGVAGYAFTFNGGAEQTVMQGTAGHATVTPVHAGDNTIVAQAIYADGTRSPATTYTFQITNAPIVSWNGDAMIPGDTAAFSMRPALSGVTSYQYTVDPYSSGATSGTLPAETDGTATLSYQLTDPGYHQLQIASVGADGTVSDARLYQFWVLDPTVSVFTTYDWAVGGGIGKTAGFGFYSQLTAQVVDYEYQVNGGPVQTVAAAADGTDTYVTFVLDRNGTNTITVRSKLADGRYSPVTTYSFEVGTAPLVTSADYPENGWGGALGVAGSFQFSGGTAGIVAFVYSFDYGATAQVPADASGAATLSYLPTDTTNHLLLVQGRLADGTLTNVTQYDFGISP